jgi:hypothetical protein
MEFSPFKDWALDNGYSDALTIDRINVDGNYEPTNCRWVSAQVQANNRRNNNYITVAGETRTITEWSTLSGISRQAIRWRLQHGWTTEDAVKQPRRK